MPAVYVVSVLAFLHYKINLINAWNQMAYKLQNVELWEANEFLLS